MSVGGMPMDILQEIFNNRELAIGIWGILALVLAFLFKPLRESLKAMLVILLSKQFIIFYAVFISFLLSVLYFLYKIDVWDIGLLKDTILWVMFVELPIFAKAIQDGKNSHFFGTLLKENIAITVIVEFYLNFWTFNFWTEFILVPLVVIISAMYAISNKEKKHIRVKKLFDSLFAIAGFGIIGYTLYKTFESSEELFNINTIQSLLLPMILFVLNLPVVYGLALYCRYEDFCVSLKGSKKEKKKMIWKTICFSGLNLYKVTSLLKIKPKIVRKDYNANDLEMELKQLEKYLSTRIGENYMKRPKFYIITCIIIFLISVVSVFLLNMTGSLKDILTLNITLSIPNVKELLTYILLTTAVFSLVLFIFVIGFSKKKYEEITQIKKFALFELLYSIKHQKMQLPEYITIDDPSLIYTLYINDVYAIKEACDKVLSSYENLLKIWEKEDLEQLQMCASSIVFDIGIDVEKINDFTLERFAEHYNNKVATAPHNDKFNNFTFTLKKDIEKYSDKINFVFDEFKPYY